MPLTAEDVGWGCGESGVAESPTRDGDKGYDSKANFEAVRDRRAVLIAPARRSPKLIPRHLDSITTSQENG